jgi:hypothetical protein
VFRESAVRWSGEGASPDYAPCRYLISGAATALHCSNLAWRLWEGKAAQQLWPLSTFCLQVTLLLILPADDLRASNLFFGMDGCAGCIGSPFKLWISCGNGRALFCCVDTCVLSLCLGSGVAEDMFSPSTPHLLSTVHPTCRRTAGSVCEGGT